MKGCVIPGSSDPITKGHLNLIERCSAMFETVTVAVMVNIHKPGAISHGDRVEIIRKACYMICIQFMESTQFGISINLHQHNISVMNVVVEFFKNCDISVQNAGGIHTAVWNFDGEKLPQIENISQYRGVVIKRFTAAHSIFFINWNCAYSIGTAGPAACSC